MSVQNLFIFNGQPIKPVLPSVYNQVMLGNAGIAEKMNSPDNSVAVTYTSETNIISFQTQKSCLIITGLDGGAFGSATPTALLYNQTDTSVIHSNITVNTATGIITFPSQNATYLVDIQFLLYLGETTTARLTAVPAGIATALSNGNVVTIDGDETFNYLQTKFYVSVLSTDVAPTLKLNMDADHGTFHFASVSADSVPQPTSNLVITRIA